MTTPASGLPLAPPDKPHAYPALDGLRGVAAIAVMLHHFRPLTAPWLFAHGYLAVDLFFLLSGFVIAHAYDARFRKGLGVPAFLVIRLIRLWPMIAFGV